ncbi:MAG: glycogen debranching protein GlgX [Saccharospirillum sp.]
MITRINPESDLEPGKPFPMGATAHNGGMNFAVYSPHATQIWLCLFDDKDQETQRQPLPARTGDVWHGFMPGLGGGVRYGYRAEGDFKPEHGLLFNPNKVLIDPYATALSAPVEPHSSLYTHNLADHQHLSASTSDNTQHIAKALTPQNTPFDWQETTRPETPWPQTVIYELHVKGFSQLNPDVPEALRGTYLGLAHEASIRHLKALGITTVQLLPCLAFMTEPRLAKAGLTNYWGYNPVCFLAPEPRYAIEDAVSELKTAVRELHRAGIEVILDVVYNHTAESEPYGPTLSHKGLHAADFYRVHPDNMLHYIDNTGCGNSVNTHNLYPMTLVMDSLRHWLNEYQVDGFRFDLAASLGREAWDFSNQAAFFKAVAQDPVVRHCKLIAEPWDIGRGGYQLGHFPEQWYECNDRFRDCARHFWRGDAGKLSELATRLMGSRDLLKKGSHAFSSSVNYVTYHDGFTLHDLVSYNERHNEANQERNLDGHGHNISHNWGVEGPTDDQTLIAFRRQMKRNFFATMLLSQGAIHLLGGDEIGRTQRGNNNAYCQDNAISWLDWEAQDAALYRFVQQCIAIRQSCSLFHDLIFSAEQLIDRPASSDKVHWYNPSGYAMEIRDWQDPQSRCVGVLLSTDIENPAINLHKCDEYYLLLINAGTESIDFTLPANPVSGWCRVFDTSLNDGLTEASRARIHRSYSLQAHSLALLGRPASD